MCFKVIRIYWVQNGKYLYGREQVITIFSIFKKKKTRANVWLSMVKSKLITPKTFNVKSKPCFALIFILPNIFNLCL